MQNKSYDRHVDLSEVDSVVSTVIRSFVSRANFGKQKYGKTLDRTDLKVTDWINHAQEELMDGILYLEKLKQTSGTTLLNHCLSPPHSPPHSPPPLPFLEAEDVDEDSMNVSVCTEDCACDRHVYKSQKDNVEDRMYSVDRVEFHLSVLSGENCEKEIKVIKNKSMILSMNRLDELKRHAEKLKFTALILYAVDTITNESKEIHSWFYDEIDVKEEYNREKKKDKDPDVYEESGF